MFPIHPGRILRRELEARELSANRLAIELKLPSGRITDIWAASEGSRRIAPCGWGNFSATARASGSNCRPPTNSPSRNARSAREFARRSSRRRPGSDFSVRHCEFGNGPRWLPTDQTSPPRHCERSEATQGPHVVGPWIGSSQGLLAMTEGDECFSFAANISS